MSGFHITEAEVDAIFGGLFEELWQANQNATTETMAARRRRETLDGLVTRMDDHLTERQANA